MFKVSPHWRLTCNKTIKAEIYDLELHTPGGGNFNSNSTKRHKTTEYKDWWQNGVDFLSGEGFGDQQLSRTLIIL